MTKRLHAMPFGTEILPGGWVRFRLWAPAAGQVNLYWRCATQHAEVCMEVAGGGWFEVAAKLPSLDCAYGFRIDGGRLLPDPASRRQTEDVHGLSRLVNPASWDWQDNHWTGRPWQDAVIYELHVGTFSSSGDFLGVIAKLDHLADLGVTALQLMPLADFPGQRNWGYDGVLHFAPDSRYGSPDDLKRLVQTAHERNLMVFLDVVYNHFGPEGNYLHCYAPQFFSGKYHTPWGDAINFDGEGCATVRQFFIHNVLYWLEEYHFDGLRFDAVHAIYDDSPISIWEEIARAVYDEPGARRRIHLVLENDDNAAQLLRRYGRGQAFTAQWNDDFHHALHVLLCTETHAHYGDYADDPLSHLGRCLTQGFAYQGEISAYRNHRPRGQPSAHLPPDAFVNFLQTHDQMGNRLRGERINLLTSEAALRAATAILLLAPSPPLLFMGQECGCRQPFCFFCDFDAELNAKVLQGRRREFAATPGFDAAEVPDPSAAEIFEHCRLDWRALDERSHSSWLELHRTLLNLRRTEIVPRLNGIDGDRAHFEILQPHVLQADWRLGDASHLTLLANLGGAIAPDIFLPQGRLLYASHEELNAGDLPKTMPAWSLGWYLKPPP